MLLKLAKPVTRHFWLNVNDAGIDIPGIVEFSNLRQAARHRGLRALLHAADASEVRARPARSSWPRLRLPPQAKSGDEGRGPESAARSAGCAMRSQSASRASSPRFPRCRRTIAGLQIADTCFYYPEDRGISESVRYGQLMAEAVTDRSVWEAEGR